MLLTFIEETQSTCCVFTRFLSSTDKPLVSIHQAEEWERSGGLSLRRPALHFEPSALTVKGRGWGEKLEQPGEDEEGGKGLSFSILGIK